VISEIVQEYRMIKLFKLENISEKWTVMLFPVNICRPGIPVTVSVPFARFNAQRE